MAPRRVTLTSLPTEIKVEILRNFTNVPSLQATIIADRSYYNAFQPLRAKLLNKLLETSIHPSLLNDAIKLDEALHSRSRPLGDLLGFCEDYHQRLSNEVSVTPEVHERLLENHRFVTIFTNLYCKQELARLPTSKAKATAESSGINPSSPSPAETLRVQRAFYHIWLYSSILRDPFPKGHFGEVPASSRAFLLDADSTHGPFHNASDHCWLVTGWQFREMLVIMQFLRDRVVRKCWAYSLRDENKADMFYFYRIGFDEIETTVTPNWHWISYVETSGLKTLAAILFGEEERALKTFAELKFYENFLFQSMIVGDQNRRGGKRKEEVVEECYTPRRICTSAMDVGKFSWKVQNYVLDEKHYNLAVRLDACLFDDERLKTWGLLMPEGIEVSEG